VKLLLDQNVSYRLIKKLDKLFPGSQQVKSIGLDNKPDKMIWDYAKKQDFVLVTFDSDFYDLSLTQGHPPKLIWIKSGNITTNNLELLLSLKVAQIENFVNDPNLGCLEIVD
jgi:predicted nuclease of predicted toxin-antitoxin system